MKEDMKEIILRRNNSISDMVYDSPVIKRNFLQSLNTKTNDIVAGIAELVQSIQELRELISPEKIYIAQFPTDFLEKQKSGLHDLMQTKSGEILSNIIDKTLPPNRNIIHNVRLKELDPFKANKIQNLSNNIMNMTVQQQLAQISEELAEIKILASSIRRGQVLDRIALVRSGKELLENALDETSETRVGSIQNAIQCLTIGRNQLGMNLQEDMKNIKGIPTKNWEIIFKFIFNNKFYDTCEKTYNDFQESFYAFIEASNYLSMAYNEINNEKALQKVFEPTKTLILDSSEKILQLSKIIVSGKSNDELAWYKRPEAIIKEMDSYMNRSFLESSDVISIEIEGYKLLGENR